jgi:hypothetical protein
MAKAAKKTKTAVPRESSSAYFARIRPKFLDWAPPTEDERRLEAEKRQEERDAELRKVTALEKAKLAEKKSGKKKLPTGK